jgi:hypothetical protein
MLMCGSQKHVRITNKKKYKMWSSIWCIINTMRLYWSKEIGWYRCLLTNNFGYKSVIQF